MSNALNNTGRSILYSCEWPLYEWSVRQVRENLFVLTSVTSTTLIPYAMLRYIKDHCCASSLTTPPFVRRVTNGATSMTSTTHGTPSSPSWTGLPLIRTSSPPWRDPGAGMTPIWYRELLKLLYPPLLDLKLSIVAFENQAAYYHFENII